MAKTIYKAWHYLFEAVCSDEFSIMYL